MECSRPMILESPVRALDCPEEGEDASRAV